MRTEKVLTCSRMMDNNLADWPLSYSVPCAMKEVESVVTVGRAWSRFVPPMARQLVNISLTP